MTDPVLRVQSSLTDRDLILLGWLADHAILSTFQIAGALFPSLDYAQERLHRLYRLRVLDRFRPQKPDGGSYPYHYVLDQLGAEVIAAQRGDDPPRRGQARARRLHLTRRANLPHLLGTNGFFTDLAAHARTHPGATLLEWWPAARCQQMGAYAEPDDDIHVRTYTATSRPDALGVWADDERRVTFFLEYDTGTKRPLSRLVDKLDGYVDLARVTGRIWPVLFWLPSQIRQRNLHQQLSDAGVRYPVATAVHRHAGGGHPAGPVWWLHRHPGAPRRLADLNPPTSAGPAP